MPDIVKVYNLNQGGVQLVKSDQHMADNELRQGKNAIFGDDEGGGGIETRPGMEQFTTVAMSGAVVGFINVGLIDLRENDFLVFPDEVVSGPTDAGNGTSSLVGAEATYWEALADDADSTLWQLDSPNANPQVGTGTILFGFPVIAEPSPNTGHKVRVRLSIDQAHLNAFVQIDLKLAAGGAALITSLIVTGIDVAVPGTLETFELDIPEAEVQNLKDNFWFDDPGMELVIGASSASPVGDLIVQVAQLAYHYEAV